MSARTAIGVLVKDNIVSIYCHNGGGPSTQGEKLYKHYTDNQKIKELVSLGSISSLGERVKPKGKHTFAEPEKGVTVSYKRDKGNTQGVEPKVTKVKKGESLHEIMRKYGRVHEGTQYVYLYLPEENDWVVFYFDPLGEVVYSMRTKQKIKAKGRKTQITRKESTDFARELRLNKDKVYRLVEKEGRVLLTNIGNTKILDEGYRELEVINWEQIENRVKGNNLTQKQAADYLYTVFNS